MIVIKRNTSEFVDDVIAQEDSGIAENGSEEADSLSTPKDNMSAQGTQKREKDDTENYNKTQTAEKIDDKKELPGDEEKPESATDKDHIEDKV